MEYGLFRVYLKRDKENRRGIEGLSGDRKKEKVIKRD